MIGEFIAVHDEPHGPFYVALVTAITAKLLRVHNYGTYNIVLATAVFKPCWNEVNGSDIVLQTDCPLPADYGSAALAASLRYPHHQGAYTAYGSAASLSKSICFTRKVIILLGCKIL